jgi:putative transposase
MSAVAELRDVVGVVRACEVVGLPRSSFYRAGQAPRPTATPAPRSAVAWALSEAEREAVRAVLDSERFQDQSVREAFATLLDEGEYYCSVRTMYRILDAHDESRERRDQCRHPQHPKPVLAAQAPNQLWSWDITKLHGPAKWVYYYLYVILDVYSRYVVGWQVAECESDALAKDLIQASLVGQGIAAGQLTLHADRGGPMISKTVAQLLADLGVGKSHSRPRVSNDNAFSESQLKTLKYRPDFPDRFGSPTDSRAYCRRLFGWYNHEHHHTALALLTPAVVHAGRAAAVLAERQAVLDAAYAAHPERFRKGPPQAGTLPPEVWINRPNEVEGVLVLPDYAAGRPATGPDPAAEIVLPGGAPGSRAAAVGPSAAIP